MFSTKILVGLLGVALAFSPELLYDAYGSRRHALGPHRRWTTSTSPALIMALEQRIVMGIALAWLFARMLAESERANQRAERYADAAEERAWPTPRAVLRVPPRTRDAQPSSTAPSSISAGPSTVTAPRTITSRPKVTSPATVSARRATQRRRAGREAGVEVAQRA